MRQVVKTGSNSVYNGGPNFEVFDSISSQIAVQREAGVFTVHVTSGAIAFGRAAIGLDGESGEVATVPEKQALASIGQRPLMNYWSDSYSRHGYDLGQVLVTNEVLTGRLSDQESHLLEMFEQQERWRIQPVVNENDAVAVEEIVLGDNDRLSAHLANLIGANTLYLLGTESGILECKKVPESLVSMANLTDDIAILELICEDRDEQGGGTGGMKTKLEAAKIFLQLDNHHNDKVVHIADARVPNVLKGAKQREVGTTLTLAALG